MGNEVGVMRRKPKRACPICDDRGYCACEGINVPCPVCRPCELRVVEFDEDFYNLGIGTLSRGAAVSAS